MISRLGLGAALVVATQAILLPPNVAFEKLSDEDLPIEVSIIDPLTQVTPVPCVGCPYAKPGDHGFVWVEGVDNSLLLNVSVGEQPETLELNGFRLYPPPVGIMMNPSAPAIPQIPADIPLSEIKEHPSTYLEHPLRVTGWSFEAGTSNTASDTGDEVLSMKLHISSLEGQSVAVPDVYITALKKASDAKLLILNVNAEDASTIPESPEERYEKECTDWPLLCKWKAILASKMDEVKTSLSGLGGKLKGCHKHLPLPDGLMLSGAPATNMHHGPNSHHDGAGMRHKKPHLHHHRPHGHHHHHKHHGFARFFHALSRVAVSVFVPVMVGIAVGMTTYFVGMLIGCAAAFIWYKLRGSPRGGDYAAVPAGDEEDGCRDTEKEVYAPREEAEFEAPPPVYEEAVEKEVVQPQ